uniref:Uncharacterized protein n=1 Tax=Ananas comosus var. bracteatus TaxID=296719 RepID=A0A6V7P4I0_ANACO|nr:unnamed protein product [Ananas comosus var. bracteatus]
MGLRLYLQALQVRSPLCWLMARPLYLSSIAREMTTINVSYIRLLSEVYEQLHLDVPQIVVDVDDEGKFVGRVDLQILRSETVIQTVHCTSSQFPTSVGAQQDVARLALNRIKDECDLQIKDANYDDSVLYKTLYDHKCTDYTVVTTQLSTQLSNLSREYDFLKECFVSTVEQKNVYVNDQIQLRRAVGECYDIVNRITALTPPPVPETNPSKAMSNQLP